MSTSTSGSVLPSSGSVLERSARPGSCSYGTTLSATRCSGGGKVPLRQPDSLYTSANTFLTDNGVTWIDHNKQSKLVFLCPTQRTLTYRGVCLAGLRKLHGRDVNESLLLIDEFSKRERIPIKYRRPAGFLIRALASRWEGRRYAQRIYVPDPGLSVSENIHDHLARCRKFGDMVTHWVSLGRFNSAEIAAGMVADQLRDARSLYYLSSHERDEPVPYHHPSEGELVLVAREQFREARRL